MLNKKDKEILRIMQENCKKSTKEIAREINFPISTVISRNEFT
ncbi:MAG: AsnC family protein [Thermoplasmatales archaeon]|nr:AsnC family protein [Candidatus Thermoplasmatota archaeon]MCG2826227.1 AsnC family protein [Thermoplasmatales archaeon]